MRFDNSGDFQIFIVCVTIVLIAAIGSCALSEDRNPCIVCTESTGFNANRLWVPVSIHVDGKKPVVVQKEICRDCYSKLFDGGRRYGH